eukprot:CAMPEP_0196655202 /NCGR_PEP_ID=MMETSP1086-20130531/4946_1 /TAXON_ID=77921 /ORGANISM="Cyanoptyche  gloeocystis , Strain SAG4.97" /LENGTH=78 /DNA_ID=CAMNT_0041987377 /DNA_START=108 /DNA_END=344 /DNA_ORIENTATION=-
MDVAQEAVSFFSFGAAVAAPVVFMAKKKGARLVITLESSAGTGFTYTTQKNRKNTTARLALKKYDPVVKQHVVFNEKK